MKKIILLSFLFVPLFCMAQALDVESVNDTTFLIQSGEDEPDTFDSSQVVRILFSGTETGFYQYASSMAAAFRSERLAKRNRSTLQNFIDTTYLDGVRQKYLPSAIGNYVLSSRDTTIQMELVETASGLGRLREVDNAGSGGNIIFWASNFIEFRNYLPENIQLFLFKPNAYEGRLSDGTRYVLRRRRNQN